MPTLKAGKRDIELTDAQLETLGLTADSEVLGCGTQACAYSGDDEDTVVKLTQDTRDAMTSYILQSVPEAGSGWAIPIHDVYHVQDDIYAIVADRAEPLPPEWADVIDEINDETARLQLQPEDWDEFYDESKSEYLKKSSTDQHDRQLRYALDIINDAILGFRKIGLGWIDHHSGNFGIYRGKPVVIDLGMSVAPELPPVPELNEAKKYIPRLR